MQARLSYLALAGLLLAGVSVQAEVKPHALFTDGMVLQRGVELPVWGTADDGEEVTVTLGKDTQTTKAQGGKWQVKLKALPAGGPHEVTIKGKNSVTLKNVLVGEVWVCSGQSNMEWSVNASADPEKVKANSKNPMIRLFQVPRRVSDKPDPTLVGSWKECGPETIGNFTAVGYHFGADLQKNLNVPIGLIQSAWGGTIAETWMPAKHLAEHSELKTLLKDVDAKKGPNQATALYNGMIYCLQPYPIKGAIWYQGESNASRAHQYRTLFPLMIQSWRDSWNNPDMPFLFVQLAPFMAITSEPQESAWAELREAQLLTTTKLKNAGMAVITDVGDPKDIHPRQKAPVGERLALAARSIAYGEKVVSSGPVYDSLKIDGNKAVLSFKSVGAGLTLKGEKLTGFTICGEDRKFVNADATILEDKIVVSSPNVAKPVAVRFGWANYPVVNLWNKDGLPASPFRTDDFPGVTTPKK